MRSPPPPQDCCMPANSVFPRGLRGPLQVILSLERCHFPLFGEKKKKVKSLFYFFFPTFSTFWVERQGQCSITWLAQGSLTSIHRTSVFWFLEILLVQTYIKIRLKLCVHNFTKKKMETFFKTLVAFSLLESFRTASIERFFSCLPYFWAKITLLPCLQPLSYCF